MSLWRRIYIERRRVVLPLVVLLVANAAVLALGVLPLKKIVASQEQRASDALLKLRDARLKDTSANKARQSKEQAELQLKKFYAEILPRSQPEAVKLANSWVQKTASEANLKFKSGQAEADRDKESSLVQVRVTLTLTGDYLNIRRFLYAVETAPEFVIIDDVHLAQATQQQGNSGALEVTVNVATYYRTTNAGGL